MVKKVAQDNNFMTTALLGGAIGLAAAYLCANNHSAESKEEECSCCGFAKSECSCPFHTSLSHPLYLGAACGLLGAGAALLLAPKSGKELREDISEAITKTQEYAADLTEKGEEYFQEASSSANQFYKKAKCAVQNFAGSAKNAVEEEVAEPIIDKIQDAVQLVQTGIQIWNSIASKRR